MFNLRVQIFAVALLGTLGFGEGRRAFFAPQVGSFFNDPFFSRSLDIDPFFSDPFFRNGPATKTGPGVGSSFSSNVYSKESIYEGTGEEPLKKTSEVLHQERQVGNQAPGAPTPVVRTVRKTMHWPSNKVVRTAYKTPFVPDFDRYQVQHSPRNFAPAPVLVYFMPSTHPYYHPSPVESRYLPVLPQRVVLQPVFVSPIVPSYARSPVLAKPEISAGSAKEATKGSESTKTKKSEYKSETKASTKAGQTKTVEKEAPSKINNVEQKSYDAFAYAANYPEAIGTVVTDSPTKSYFIAPSNAFRYNYQLQPAFTFAI